MRAPRRVSRVVALATAALAMVFAGLPAGAAPAPAPADGCVRPLIHTAAPTGTTSCPGVRPGGLLIVPSLGYGCTMGFLYSGSGRYYMTTAGHCAMPETDAAGEPLPGEFVWKEGAGPVVTTGAGKPFGRFVFASFKGNYDIAVILVTKGIKPSASMCHFGGPTGLSTTTSSALFSIEHYGNSVGFGDVLPARSGFVPGMPDKYMTWAWIPSFKGDSGGPVVSASTGRAIGLITAIGFGGPPPFGGVWITRLGPQMTYAQKILKRSLKLRTAKHSAPLL